MTILGEAWIAIHGQTAGVGKEIESGVDRELADVDKKGREHGKRFGSAFSTAATGDVSGGLKNLIPEAAIAAAVVGAGASLYKLGSTFAAVSDNMRVQTGATGSKLEGLNNTFKHVATEVPDSMAETGKVVTDLAQKLGLTGKPLDDLSVKFLNLAHITHGDVNAQMDSTIQLFRNFDVAGKDQGATLDMLYRASQASGIGFDQLSSTLTAAGPTLRQVGLNAAEGAAFIATLTKAGVDASQVMPGLAKAAATAAKEHKSAAEVFGQTFDRIKHAKNDVEASGVALEVFGARAGPRMATLIREGKLSYQDMLSTIQGGKDTINKSTEDTEHFGEKWDKFKNKILVGLAPIASEVFDGIGKGMENIGVVTGPVLDLFDRLRDSFDRLFASVGGPMAAISIAWGSLIDGFTGGAGTADHEIGGLAQTFARIGAVVQGVVTFMSSLWNQHATEIHKILGQLSATFQSEFTAISTIITTVVNIVTVLWDRFGNTLLGKIRVAFDAILTIISGALETLKGIFDLVTAILTGKWGKAWDAIKEIVAGVWKEITGIVRLGIDAISTVIEAGKALISAAWSAVWHGIATLVTDTVISPVEHGFDALVGFVTGLPSRMKTAAAGMFDGIKDAFKGAINWIIGKWNDLQLKIGGQHVGLPFGMGFDIPSITLNTPNIPMLADGGIVTGPTLAVLGEAGPEAVIPLNQGASALQSLLGTIPHGWTIADYVTNLVKSTQVALQSADVLISSWVDRIGPRLVAGLDVAVSNIEAGFGGVVTAAASLVQSLGTVDGAANTAGSGLGSLDGALSSLGSAASEAGGAFQQAAGQIMAAADQVRQAGGRASSGGGGGGGGSTPTPAANLTGNGGADFHQQYVSSPEAVQQYLWAIGHPGGEPYPGYESPSGTLYDDGGYLPPGGTAARNLTGQPEWVLTAAQLIAAGRADTGGSAKSVVLAPTFELHGTSEELIGMIEDTNKQMLDDLVAEMSAGFAPTSV